VDLYKYYNPEGSSVDMCFDQLRGQGYKIIGTSPNSNSIPISELKADEKIALVFGNEHEGISPEVQGKVDGLVHIPMLGFTESFNISVSASIFLFDLIQKTQKLDIPDFHLREDEKNLLRLKWYRSIVKRSDLHEKMYLEKLKGN